MADAFTSSHVNHFGKVNRDYVCTQSNGGTFTLPKDTEVVIVDMKPSRDRLVIWWESKDLYARLTIQAARSLIVVLPERRWTTENTQGRKFSIKEVIRKGDKYDEIIACPVVQTVDMDNKSIRYGEWHHGYVSRMSTDGMSFIVNILHGPDSGRKGVRIPIKYGSVLKDTFADENPHWMFKRLTFVKNYTCVDRNGAAVHTFKKGDRSCVVHGVDAIAMLLRVRSSSVEDSQRVMRVDISARAVEPDTDCDGNYHFNTRDGPVNINSGGWWRDPGFSFSPAVPDDEMLLYREEMRQSRHKIRIPPAHIQADLSDTVLQNPGAQW